MLTDELLGKEIYGINVNNQTLFYAPLTRSFAVCDGKAILNIPGCNNCFAKWHCRGGCPYSKRGEYFTSLSPERCAMIRKIVALKLMYVSSE